jgi:hypothetical protein
VLNLLSSCLGRMCSVWDFMLVVVASSCNLIQVTKLIVKYS